MDLKSKRHRLMTVVATAVAFGVLGLSLSVVAFGQSTTTQPLGDYTSTVPTSTTPGDYTSTVPTATTPAPAPVQTETAPSSGTSTPTTPPKAEAAPQTAKGTSPNVAAAPTGTTPKALAFTGFDPLPLLAVGLLLVGAGAFVQLRRRRDA
jgi:LPXTG-motif cell wall-anchored protein